MPFSTNDCKIFIAENSDANNVPPDNWKRISKIKSTDGWVRTFEHKKGYIIEILEDISSSSLKWISTENKNSVSNNISLNSKFTDETFKELPKNVKLFINTLRSLQGKNPLENKEFDVSYQQLWKNTIKDRKSCKEKNIPSILLHDSEGCDESWNILQDNFDKSWSNDAIIKYVASYFWFAFVNDTRDDNENPLMLVTPKGFWDDGRIPMIFDEYKLSSDLLENLTEVMESTLEFDSDIEDPLEKIIKAYQKMKNIGIEFSIDLQREESHNFGEKLNHDFCNIKWINKNLDNFDKKFKIK